MCWERPFPLGVQKKNTEREQEKWTNFTAIFVINNVMTCHERIRDKQETVKYY